MALGADRAKYRDRGLRMSDAKDGSVRGNTCTCKSCLFQKVKVPTRQEQMPTLGAPASGEIVFINIYFSHSNPWFAEQNETLQRCQIFDPLIRDTPSTCRGRLPALQPSDIGGPNSWSAARNSAHTNNRRAARPTNPRRDRHGRQSIWVKGRERVWGLTHCDQFQRT